MLKSMLLQPQMLEALGRAGHGSKVLIADGNYPFSTRRGRRAALVCLNLSPGVVSATQALAAVASAVPIEAAAVMQPLASGPYAMETDPPIWDQFRQLLRQADAPPAAVQLDRLERFAFYDAAGADDVALTIATAEQRIYANILLTIGVVMPG